MHELSGCAKFGRQRLVPALFHAGAALKLQLGRVGGGAPGAGGVGK